MTRRLRARSWASQRPAPPLHVGGVTLPPIGAPIGEARLTVGVGEVALVLAAGPRARAGASALLAGAREGTAAGLRARRALGAGGSLLVVDARHDPYGVLAAHLRAAAGGRAVLVVARVPDLAAALARLMLGGAALLRVHAARGGAGRPLPRLALWSLVDGRPRLHARVAGHAAARSVAGASGPS
ncbi:MAG TPA: hypothetical protein VEZ47_01210 [Gemmatirosa sp.]|nr:hypothetical protein [Gemmatirosa sp.]